jgi:enolase-phosphatase E1
VTLRLAAHGVRVVLLDIEGTTTPIAFVHEVLFPFAREHLAEWLQAAAPADRLEVLRRLGDEHRDDLASGEAVPPWRTTDAAEADMSVRAYVNWLMDRDRKSPGLKYLQGLIWERGYQAGRLRGEVYDDVPRALARWRAQGIETAIYSSGSVLAQRRLFQTTTHGDLGTLIGRYFDTAAGPKRAASSYARIAAALACQPRQLLFVSDVADELLAAVEAGCQTLLSLRPGNPPQSEAGTFGSIRSFDEIG